MENIDPANYDKYLNQRNFELDRRAQQSAKQLEQITKSVQQGAVELEAMFEKSMRDISGGPQTTKTPETRMPASQPSVRFADNPVVSEVPPPTSSSPAPRHRLTKRSSSQGKLASAARKATPPAQVAATPPTSSRGLPSPDGGETLSSAVAYVSAIPDEALDMADAKDATLKLQRTRIRGLEEELSKLKRDFQDCLKDLRESENEAKGLKAERNEWSKVKKQLELQSERHKQACDEAKMQLQQKSQAIAQHKQDQIDLEKERRQLDQEVKSREVRLTRALEEVSRTKSILENVKAQEREEKALQKGDFNKLQQENKKLEKQKAELITAFKKQRKLIDVLKRQKVHMEAARALAFTEEEFMRTLDMGME